MRSVLVVAVDLHGGSRRGDGQRDMHQRRVQGGGSRAANHNLRLGGFESRLRNDQGIVADMRRSDLKAAISAGVVAARDRAVGVQQVDFGPGNNCARSVGDHAMHGGGCRLWVGRGRSGVAGKSSGRGKQDQNQGKRTHHANLQGTAEPKARMKAISGNSVKRSLTRLDFPPNGESRTESEKYASSPAVQARKNALRQPSHTHRRRV